ncbi:MULTISPECIES: YerC/YecD family TrpR-related protein [unclassified Stenotrophomonas]|jgi:TrpR-related protein YerC/YecD|uniref:YerC/YecD family TrpR-related protein n=1 Tax=unclassified Stenotrophomonas TaxID=196198 RepID=UPI00178526F0|nr:MULTISPECIES: YerC/YecD family TrpR-related protein [unclassified Stenotrophomonas]MBD8643438.1 DNA-binding transcriptional regulator [Stenotrophomonas sp. CFBP 13724]MDY1032096.1 YerC/YecD family TrpR-related protein [Stenotrophomonas sp. CFBP8980]
MKLRPAPREKDAQADLACLAAALAALSSAEQVTAFLRDLCTPAELEALSDRWKVVPLLQQGVPYREIHELTGVSVTTTGRVARSLEHGHGGYAAAIAVIATPSFPESK